jgi:Patatin-like phospholipase
MSTEPSASTQEAASSNPLRYCDIVMKGGITSGVVYPPAVVELSKTFSFRNVGGTSAGAIAAAVTAAAELGRDTPNGGFARIAKLPLELGDPVSKGGESLLFSLFRPQKSTNSLFRILVAGIGTKSFKPIRIVLAAIKNFTVWAALGSIPGLVLAYLTACSANGFLFWWSLVCALILLVLGAVLMVGVGIYRKVTNAIPANGFGLSRGLMEDAPHAQVLTPFLSNLINEAAGRERTDPPLTFGELWQIDDADQERKIDLQMMTTNLTTGRPYRLPFIEDIFFFDPEEWAKFFPPKVMSWLLEKSSSSAEAIGGATVRSLPTAKDLPVVVATRMSLSFPILLSAVPLYASDFGRQNDEDQKPQKCWFSDGGICSNFPVHFFDSPLPRWPTFAINLKPFHPDHMNEPVFMPDKNKGGITEIFTQFDQGSGRERLTGFVAALINTLRNWTDNMQTRLPGYRDRIAHVSLNNKREGGINLNMPADVITALGKRGEDAAKLLTKHFTTPADKIVMSWDNHRWVRYRSLMELFEKMIEKIDFAIKNPIAPDRSYMELIDRKSSEAPGSYRWKNSTQRAFGYKATDDVSDLAVKWQSLRKQDPDATFTAGDIPSPQPELRVKPRV